MESLRWLLPIFSGLLDGGARNVVKATRVHPFTLLAAGSLLPLPLYIAWFYIDGVPDIGSRFFVALASWIPLYIIAQTLSVIAYRCSPLILTIPYLSFTPVFLLVTSPLMGGGMPTVFGALGILLIAVGLYLLHARNGGDIWEPFRSFRRERGSKLMLLVAFIYAITSNLDLSRRRELLTFHAAWELYG